MLSYCNNNNNKNQIKLQLFAIFFHKYESVVLIKRVESDVCLSKCTVL